MAMLSSPNPIPSGFLAILPGGFAMMPIRMRWIGYCEASKQKLQSPKSEMAGISLCPPVGTLDTSTRFDRLRQGWLRACWEQSRHKRVDRGRSLAAGGDSFWWPG
jgi:hypothetical protein